MRIITIVLIALLMFTSCGSKNITGEIVDKEYKGQWVQIIPITHYVNGTPITYTTTIVHEEGYYIRVRQDKLIGEDERKDKYVSVSKEEYKRLKIGDRYENGGNK